MYKLLIVDDETTTREGLVKHIAWEEFGVDQIEEAKDGLDGLDKITTFNPDIVISDIRMPLMNGVEFISQVRELLPRCRVIFLSGYSDKEYLKAAIRLKAISYVEKPVDLEELREAITEAISQLEDSGVAVDAVDNVQLPDINNRNIKKVEQYIHDNYHDSCLSVKDLADYVCLTPTYLSYLFKKVTDKTISEYISEYRIGVSKKLMSEPQIKMTEIASRVGYTDSNYYTRAFKKIVGMTPSAYREKYV